MINSIFRLKISAITTRESPRKHDAENRATPSRSLSPIMAGVDSPLGRPSRQVDGGDPRQGLKRALSSSKHSEINLTRENPRKYDAVRHSKSHSVIA